MMTFWKDDEKRTLLCLGLSLPALIVSFFHLLPLPVDAAWVAALLCGLPIARDAAVGLTRWDVKADVLVSLALIASLIIGEIFAAGEVAFIMLLGSYLEERTVAKARAGLEKLVRLTPVTARVVRDGEEAIVPADEVKVGDTLRVLAGETVAAEIRGQTIYAGTELWLSERGLTLPAPFTREAAQAKADGATVIYVMAERETLGFLVLSDTLRPDAADTIEAIRAAGVDVVLLTGDAPQAAAHIAGLAGISEVRADCLPEDKLTVIQQYQAQGNLVCMVGDGINDAPALKAAHVGIAMGGVGSDIAIEAADAALVRDDIREIPPLLRLSKRVMRTIYINLTLAMFLNFAAVALAAAGLLHPVMGALVHNAGSVAVVIHSSLLLTRRH
ncbi:MAG: HAD-IC family P-type ATPase [Oscillospiraceae bacterium]|nr:HAD-IC family P-type ATPase [Oscillospiraceae bacterium]